MPEAEALRFSLDTKTPEALAKESTYRVQIFGLEDRSYKAKNTGTYRTVEGEELLVPCVVDDDGQFVPNQTGGGMNGINGDVYLVLSSPARAYNDDGSFYYTPDNPGDFYVNAPENKKIGDYGTISFRSPLFRPYSTISFEFYKKPDVEDFSVQDGSVKVMGVQGLREEVKIYPALRQVSIGSARQERKVDLSDGRNESVSSMKNYELLFKTKEADRLKIASGIYAPKSEAAKYLGLNYTTYLLDGDYIYMSCIVLQGGRALEVRLPLNDKTIEMMPQHNYVYKLLVESDYIHVSLDVYGETDNDWEEEASDSSVGELINTIQLGAWVNNSWQPLDNIGFEIV